MKTEEFTKEFIVPSKIIFNRWSRFSGMVATLVSVISPYCDYHYTPYYWFKIDFGNGEILETSFHCFDRIIEE